MTEQIAQGLIPFVECRHDGPAEWVPAHYQIGRLTHLVSCVFCLRTFPDDALTWVTPQEARERFGWSLVESVPTHDPD